MKRWIKPKYTALISILLLTAGMKYWIINSGAVPFNSDEAVVALMARHILKGESPVFYYGQAYMGSLGAYLDSLGFAILGEAVWVIRLVQSLLYLIIVASTFSLAEQIFKSWKAGTAAGLIMAIPAVNTSLYTTVSFGYGEAILLGNLVLLITLRIAKNLQRLAQHSDPEYNKDERINWLGLFFGWGVLVGLGLWVFGLTFVYTIPSFLLLLWWVDKPHIRRNQVFVSGWFAAAGAGFLLGAEPWWAYAFKHGINNLVGELTGNVVAIEHSSFLLRTVDHTLNYFLLGLPALLGFRPPWEVRWLILPLIPFVLIFWVLVLSWTAKKVYQRRTEIGLCLMVGVILTQMVLFLFTPFGIDPSGRYFVPLAGILAVLAGGFVTNSSDRWKKVGSAGLIMVVLFHFLGNLDSIKRNPPGLTTQFNYETIIDHSYDGELASFLLEKGETHGYTNYWLTYPLAFTTNEQLIFSPRLPYHQNLAYTSRDDRYLAYTESVQASSKTAYITTGPEVLDEEIRSELTKLGVEWQENKIGDYQIFYGLSRPVHPVEIGLGADNP